MNVPFCGIGASYARPVQVVFAGEGAVNLINSTANFVFVADFQAFTADDGVTGISGVISLPPMSSISFDGTFDVWAGQISMPGGAVLVTKVGGSSAASAV
jgi:hypothetical protein